MGDKQNREALPVGESKRRVSREATIENLKYMIKVAAKAGASSVVILPQYAALRWNLAMPLPDTKFMAERLFGQAIIPELKEMKPGRPDWEKYFLTDGFHPTYFGSAYIAQEIAKTEFLK